MDTYSKVGRAEQDLKWARIWFKQFSKFHHRRGEDQRPFSAEEVVAFLRSKRDAKVPAWKRMKIIEAMMVYRLQVQKQGIEDLVPLQKKYVQDLKAFMTARGLTCLADFEPIGDRDVEAHLSDLAVDGNVAPSTQNRAYYAMVKFFKLVLKQDMGRIETIRASKGTFVPTVLGVEEVSIVFAGLRGVYLVIAHLLYGCGMRISEAMRLRVKDIDFAN